MTWIAEQRVIWAFPSGERRDGRIAIGTPVARPEQNDALCAYALEGLEYVAGPMFGASAMQALCMALRFVGLKLRRFQAAGGIVLNEYGEEAGIEDVFGPLLVDKL